ncbi:helix-turn-helix transcriptional regulator [Sedimentibacter hydroxybenzoicus DSM 7310]|uniref:Helix-turn-helix transcriptional regulator n=1 Tax=Sedimentibacter hydroxybenzoicus DSM 7310 TaxID=1123245 RepID=A0A974BLB9_SEDHY|nr:helix-turn-helix transcriptional regulator [Sedimentibacter hydroxybenzoicus]NYB74837.1 helix-turn-helix transcriptional regulator [Sedimentibacter hydroxybenzoicus DSM 7310]
MKVGENIKLYRKKKGLTQTELGKKIGVTGATVTRYEKGQLNPSIEQIGKISLALDTSPSELMGLDIIWNEVKDRIETEERLRQVFKAIDCEIKVITGVDPSKDVEDSHKYFTYYKFEYKGNLFNVNVLEYRDLMESVKKFLRFQVNELMEKHNHESNEEKI